MPQDDPRLAAMVGSRICHDLASPIGAALTGLEFLTDMPGGCGPEEMALLRDSLTGARATLEMLRMAFGTVGAGEALDARALGATVRGHLAARPRLHLDWALDGPLARPDAQLVALAVLCAAQALPRGGALVVARAGGARITVTVTGPLGLPEPMLWDGLAGRAALPEADPRRIEFHLLAARIAQGDAAIEVTSHADTLAITLIMPVRD
ncbi:histidine phosphotransferase ChpT [Roseovarius sp. MBR-78]|uniref:histidine phosphotransferase family protein n=1 Tax=Roseovarius sp. MBR-78 TaxID=3156460 RepID=UPI00339322D9